MAWTIKLSETAQKQLKKLDKQIAKRITRFLRERVLGLDDPRLLGEPLLGNYQGYWRYRMGDYRIVCELHDEELVIYVVSLGHRKEIYTSVGN